MRLLLTPLCKDLLCAAFPGTPKLPTPQSRGLDRKKCLVVPSSWEWSGPSPLSSLVDMPSSPERSPNAALGTRQAQPQPRTQPLADYPPPETTQSNPNLFIPWDQATALMPISAMSPPHPQLGPQAYMQGPLQLSQAQQILEVASQNILVVSNKLDRWWTGTDAARFMADSFKPPGSELSIGGHSAPRFGVGEDDTSHPSTDSIFWDADPTVSFGRSPISDGRGDGAIVAQTVSLRREFEKGRE